MATGVASYFGNFFCSSLASERDGGSRARVSGVAAVFCRVMKRRRRAI